MKSILDKDMTNDHPLYPYLRHELTEIQTLMDGLRISRIKRSWNFVGSAWKWIAGNPDHDDFEVIKDKMNNVLENNNKQVIINQLYNERINNITRMANEITNTIHRENKLNDQLALNIQYKLKVMKEEIVNIKYAIHWAKAGIINSLVLSNSEIKLAISTLEAENLPYSTPEEALDFANVKIINSKSCLLYIVYIPLTTLEIYEKLLVKPVKKNSKIAEIEYENIIKSHNKIYSINRECKTVNSLSICNQKNILDISNTTCLPNLLKSRPSKCNHTNDHHIPMISEISEGLILLNRFDGIINIENETQALNGTYLIKFNNITVTVNDNIFISKEKSTIMALPAILQPTPEENGFKEKLSLQMMKEIHINNTGRIELLQTEKNIQQITSWGLFSIIIVMGLTFAIVRLKSNNQIRVINTTNIEDSVVPETRNKISDASANQIEEAQVTNIAPPGIGHNQRRKFYDTPFF